jgi:hypothetical protein
MAAFANEAQAGIQLWRAGVVARNCHLMLRVFLRRPVEDRCGRVDSSQVETAVDELLALGLQLLLGDALGKQRGHQNALPEGGGMVASPNA